MSSSTPEFNLPDPTTPCRMDIMGLYLSDWENIKEDLSDRTEHMEVIFPVKTVSGPCVDAMYDMDHLQFRIVFTNMTFQGVVDFANYASGSGRVYDIWINVGVAGGEEEAFTYKGSTEDFLSVI